MFKKISLCIALMGTIFNAKSMELDNLINNAKALGIGVALIPTSIIIHELGHALTAKVLNNDPIKITIGEGITNKNPLYQNSWLTIERRFWRGAYAEFYKDQNKPWKNIAKTIAGPIVQTAYAVGALHHFRNEENMLYRIFPAFIIVASLSNLIPAKNSNSDGEHIAHQFSKDHRYCLGPMGSCISQWTILMYTIKRYVL